MEGSIEFARSRLQAVRDNVDAIRLSAGQQPKFETSSGMTSHGY